MGDTGKENIGFVGDNIQQPPGAFLAVGQQASGGHTYVYEPNKSLRRLTMEALPSEENYRKLSQIYMDQRPTIEELMNDEKIQRIDEEKAEVKPAITGKIVKFGWIEGVG